MAPVPGWLRRDELTPAEAALADASITGEWCTLPSSAPGTADPDQGEEWGPEQTVRARVLYQLLTRTGTLWPDDFGEVCAPRAVRLRAARITEQLDLGATEVRCPLQLDACYIECQEPVSLREATFPVIRLTGCRLRSGLDAAQLCTTGDFDLQNVQAHATMRLAGAHIGGQLVLSGGKFRNPGEYAINADSVQVGQSVLCRTGFQADGEVRLAGARIGGQLSMDGGKFRNRGKCAVNAESSRTEDTWYWRPNEVSGDLNLEFAGTTVWVDDRIGRSALALC